MFLQNAYQFGSHVVMNWKVCEIQQSAEFILILCNHPVSVCVQSVVLLPRLLFVFSIYNVNKFY